MSKLENLRDVLPGKAPVCPNCPNVTDAFGCTVDNQTEFYIRAMGSTKEGIGAQLEEKLARMPEVGCPIRTLLEMKESGK